MMTAAVVVPLALAALFALWVLHSAHRPFAQCKACKGNPRKPSKSGKSWRLCYWCGGRGHFVRPGRRVWEKINPSAARK